MEYTHGLSLNNNCLMVRYEDFSFVFVSGLNEKM